MRRRPEQVLATQPERPATWARPPPAPWMRRQHLLEPAPHARLLDVVRDHVGIQAQVMSSAELSLRARVAGVRRPDVGAALWDDRTLVKTWAMRGTLHLVAATELPELVRGLGTRLNWLTDVWLRYFKVTREEMLALQAAIGEVLSADPMTRTELAEGLAERLGDPAFAERVTSSWGTFLKPAAGRGYLAFGPERGRNVTFVHPGAWLGIEIPEPDEAGIDPLIVRHLHAFPGATKGELARWWGVTAGKLTKPLKRLDDRLELVDLEGNRAYVLAEDLATLRRTRPEPPSTIRLLGGFDPYTLVAPEGGGAAAADGQAPARLADRGLDQRGRPVRGRRRGHLDPRAEAEGDDDRGQPVATPDEGGAGDRPRGGRRDRRVPRARRRGPPPRSTTRAERRRDRGIRLHLAVGVDEVDRAVGDVDNDEVRLDAADDDHRTVFGVDPVERVRREQARVAPGREAAAEEPLVLRLRRGGQAR